MIAVVVAVVAVALVVVVVVVVDSERPVVEADCGGADAGGIGGVDSAGAGEAIGDAPMR